MSARRVPSREKYEMWVDVEMERNCLKAGVELVHPLYLSLPLKHSFYQSKWVTY